jgi:tRNA dimethylallyltransferase
MKNKDTIIILGCTATGKTSLATHLADAIGGEIISADSRQVFKGMDVGTGKDLGEYTINNQNIPYHLINVKEAGEIYSVYEFQKDFLNAYDEIQERGNTPILAGGTGLYLESVIKGYRLLQVPENKDLRSKLEAKTIDELAIILANYKQGHNTTDTTDITRAIRAIEVAVFEEENKELINNFPQINHTIFGVHFDREIIKKRITDRLKQRLKHEGMIEEVEKLLGSGISAERLKFYGLEYKFITQYLLGEINRTELFEKLNVAIHQFAKRQATWFRRMERNGIQINWIDGNLPIQEKVNFIQNCIGE